GVDEVAPGRLLRPLQHVVVDEGQGVAPAARPAVERSDERPVDRLLDGADLVDRYAHVADEERHAGQGNGEVLDPVALSAVDEAVDELVDEGVDLVPVP